MIGVLIESTSEGTEQARANTWREHLAVFKAFVPTSRFSGRYHIIYSSALKTGQHTARAICGNIVTVDWKEGVRELDRKNVLKLKKKPEHIPDCYCIKCMRSVLI
jgi:hypothetical protein